MDQLPSSSFSLQGFVRSSHALLAVLGICSASLFVASLAANFEFGKYLFGGLFSVLILCVLARYVLKGPEADRSQPSISVTNQDNRMQAQILNIDPTPDIVAILQAAFKRRPLPAPAAIITGLASDPSSYQPLTPEAAKVLQEQDSQLFITSSLVTPKPAGSAPPSA